MRFIEILRQARLVYKLLRGETKLYWVDEESVGEESLFEVKYNSSGLDLRCQTDITIPVGGSMKVPLGIRILPSELPLNFGIAPQIWARSGLSTRLKLEAGAGLGDNNYTGVYAAHLYNNGDTPFRAAKGARVCQLCFPIVLLPRDAMCEVSELPETSRGDRGFGSSGV